MAVERLEPRTMASDAVESIRRAIHDGSLAPGERLREAEIAKKLGISRIPVREALRRLEAEGIVVRTPYRGSAVAEVSAQLARDLAQVRRTVELLAYELAQDELASAPNVEFIRGLLGKMQTHLAQGDVVGAIDDHLGIHRQVYRLSHNQVLVDWWGSWESALRLHLAAHQSTFAESDLPVLYEAWIQSLEVTAHESAEAFGRALDAISNI